MTSPTDPPASPPEDEGLLLPDGSPASPDAHPKADQHGDERSPYSPLAVIARVPLPVRRITKVQAIALVVFTLISLGPILALVIVLRSDTSDVPVVAADEPITAEDGLNLALTITTVNAVTREMAVRMTVKSTSTGPTGLIEGGRMTETVNIGLPAAPGSLQGDSTVTLEQGSTVSAIEFVVQLTDGSIARYPYDTYNSQILIIASRETPDSTTTTTSRPTGSDSATPDRESVPISVEVSADVPGFVVEGQIPPGQPASTRTIDLEVRRNGPTLLYTTWIMLLWWALSVSAVFIAWSVAIWRSSTPPWAYGYLVGVLFALAPLRGALPGQPPYGVLIDYVSFYWAVGTMGLGLLLLVSFFVRDARADGRADSRSRHEEEELEDLTADAAYDPATDTSTADLPLPIGSELIIGGGTTRAPTDRHEDGDGDPARRTSGDGEGDAGAGARH